MILTIYTFYNLHFALFQRDFWFFHFNLRTIPGCENCAQKFYSEEIDGQALLLLKIEHMIHTMKLKLGPALKIASHLRTVKLEYGIHTRSKYLSSPFSWWYWFGKNEIWESKR